MNVPELMVLFKGSLTVVGFYNCLYYVLNDVKMVFYFNLLIDLYLYLYFEYELYCCILFDLNFILF